MPGISFLFKKTWHPSRMDNQKRIFAAEENVKAKAAKDEEAAKEVKRQKELFEEGNNNDSTGNARDTSLKFMYCPDVKDKSAVAKQDIFVDGDDELTKRFKRRLSRKDDDYESDTATKIRPSPDNLTEDLHLESDCQNPCEASERSATEHIGRCMSQQQLEERFPQLKNAPMDSAYSSHSAAVHHKPFNDVIRRIQCLRCGTWGHASGDRECPLKDYNPHDIARQKREDPLSYINSDEVIKDKEALAQSFARGKYYALASQTPQVSLRAQLTVTKPYGGAEGQTYSLVESDDEHDVDTNALPVSEARKEVTLLLASLTPKEKKLLHKKLQVSISLLQ